jgi:hypothetical protein
MAPTRRTLDLHGFFMPRSNRLMHTIGEIRRSGQLFHLYSNLCLWSGLLVSGERYLFLKQSDLPPLTEFGVLLLLLLKHGRAVQILVAAFFAYFAVGATLEILDVLVRGAYPAAEVKISFASITVVTIHRIVRLSLFTFISCSLFRNNRLKPFMRYVNHIHSMP